MTVPGPTRTRSSLSLRFMAPSLSRADRHSQPMGLLRPEGKAEPGAGAGRRAIAGLVERPFEREMLNRAGEADPVADLGAAGVELVAWQRLDSGGIVPLEHVDKAAVERLVHDKMRQPARPDDADPLVLGIALDGRADRLPELVAAPRRRLVRRVVGVDADRHDRHDILHNALVHKADRVPFAFALRSSARSSDVELAVDELVDQVPRQSRIDRVVARGFFFVPARR